MKKVTINKNMVGIISKRKAVKRILTEGKYWLGFGETIEYHDMGNPFFVPYPIEVLLTIPGFQDLIDLVDVADNEICLVFKNGNYIDVLEAGQHVFWKGLIKYSFQKFNINDINIPKEIDRKILALPRLSNFVRCFVVDPFEKALMLVDEKVNAELEPGIYYFWKNMTTIKVWNVDMRMIQMDMPGQEVLTKDKAQIRINFVVQYQVMDLFKALTSNKDYKTQIYNLIKFALRTYIGSMTLDSLMEYRESINTFVMNECESQLEALGIKLDKVGIKDIILPGDIRQIMNQVLLAEKNAQANSITRREETAATRSLLNTAKLLEENSMLYRLKEMEYVEKLSEKINNITVSGNGQLLDQLKQLFIKE